MEPWSSWSASFRFHGFHSGVGVRRGANCERSVEKILGKLCATRGLRVGRQAQIMPELISAREHS